MKLSLCLLCFLTWTTPLSSLFSEETAPYEDVSKIEEAEELKDLSPIIQESIDVNALETRTYSHSGANRKRHSYNRRYIRKEREKNSGSWKPNFEDGNTIQPKTSWFFRTDIGVGFLYFRGVKGNLQSLPAPYFTVNTFTAPYNQRLMYNRTPLYEYQLGYRFSPYFQMSLAYVHQGDVSIETKNIVQVPNLANVSNAFSQFKANLNLDGILIKFYTEAPWPLMFKNIMANLYLGSGCGLGWQSWTQVTNNTVTNQGFYFSTPLIFRQKNSLNVIWMSDIGLRVQRATAQSQFSVLGGVKFNIWGQARSIGKLSQQGTNKYALFKPFSIKTVYQWAPYLGVKWSFPENVTLSTKDLLKRTDSPLITQMNVGVGILKFKKVRGNLVLEPNSNSILGWQNASVGQKISYNRTPLFEYLVMYRFLDAIQLGLSYQNQGGVGIQTPNVTSQAGSGLTGPTSTLSSYLNLNAILLKGYVKYSLLEANRKAKLATYFAFGFGPGWQSWSRVTVNRMAYDLVVETPIGGNQTLRQKTMANFVFNLDWGLQFMVLNNKSDFSILGGCKYNYWGQARSIGKQSQQGNSYRAINDPFKIKKIYQWAPYLGVQWNFPRMESPNKIYYLDGQTPNTWKPYLIDSSVIQKKSSLITQFNVGLGTLRFNGVQGNIIPNPDDQFIEYGESIPIKGRLSHNNTPIYEYILGYRLCPRLKFGLSYQHQGNITVQTKQLYSFGIVRNPFFTNELTNLTADLALDSLMAKVYYECSKYLVWKSLVHSPYIALATGVVWQTWKNISLDMTNILGPLLFLDAFEAMQVNFRQKISAGMGMMIDFGVRTQTPYPNSGFSILWGCKFNLWGQARSIGKASQQLVPKYSLFKPFKIKSVYQWAPYLGVQWNF